MDEMPSAQFRKQYAKLEKATIVTVSGHPIGVWMPRGVRDFTLALEQVEKLAGREVPSLSTQAKRDDLLRKINRGK